MSEESLSNYWAILTTTLIEQIEKQSIRIAELETWVSDVRRYLANNYLSAELQQRASKLLVQDEMVSRVPEGP